MIEYTLHKIKKEFVLTSNEKCSQIYSDFYFENYEIYKFSETCLDDLTEISFPIIAQQEQIDFSSLTEEEQKKIGWYDVEKLKKQQGFSGSHYFCYEEGFIEGFQKAQELLSDRRFTLEEMFNLMELLRDTESRIMFEVKTRRYIESLSQKSWKVEIQHECNGIKKQGESCTKNNNCTYPNCGKVKIIKLL